MITAGLMSSETAEHFTPPSFLELVRKVGTIGLDPCWSPKSFVNPVVGYAGIVTHPGNGLTAMWDVVDGLVFVNPPYGRGIGQWTERCARAAWGGVEVLALLPARTDAQWFQKMAQSADAFCFLRGRLRFWTDRWCNTCDGYGACTRKGHDVVIKEKAGEGDSAPFPSVVVLWGKGLSERFAATFGSEGIVFT